MKVEECKPSRAQEMLCLEWILGLLVDTDDTWNTPNLVMKHKIKCGNVFQSRLG